MINTKLTLLIFIRKFPILENNLYIKSMNKIIIIVFIASFCLRLLFLSNWLEDWDSVQFALALHHYSLALELPHPPGYPLYILLGKFLYLFFQDDNKAFSFLSAFLGSLSIFPLFLLTKKMFNKKVALGSTLLFLAAPVQWTLSEVALTNIPGQFFLILLIYLLYKYSDQPKIIIILAGVFGFTLGLRFTEFPIITSLLALILIKSKNLRLSFHTILSFIFGISLWLIPLILITGFNEFIKAYLTNANYIINHDTLMNTQLHKLTILKLRLDNLQYLLKIGYGTPFIFVSLITFLLVIVTKRIRQDANYQFLMIWLISYIIPLVFFFNLEVTRYTLPLLAPLSIILTATLYKLIPKRSFFYIIIFILSIILFIQGFSQVSRFKQTIPPIVKPVLFVKQNFKPIDTVILPTTTLRHFQYYASEFKTYDLGRDKNILLDNKTVIIDHPSTIEKIPELKKFRIVEKQDYYGDKDIYNRVPSTTIYILKKN